MEKFVVLKYVIILIIFIVLINYLLLIIFTLHKSSSLLVRFEQGEQAKEKEKKVVWGS